MMLWLRWLALACFMGGLVQAEPANACVIVTAQNASFGSHSSFTIRNQAQATSTTSSGVRCDVKIASLFSTDYIEAKLTSTNNMRLLNANGDSIGYGAYAGPNQQQPWSNNGTVNYASSTILSILGIGSDGEVTFPIYFTTLIGSNVTAGTYKDTITIGWRWNYCTGIDVAGICLTALIGGVNARKTGTGSTTLEVSVTVTNDCVISTTSVVFGSAPTAATFAPATGTLSITCTKGLNYTVGLGPGANPVGGLANGRRQMANNGNRLQYDLYKDSTLWQRDANRVSSPAAATGNTAQTFNVIGRIYPDQTTPPEGAYSDNVVVDIKY